MDPLPLDDARAPPADHRKDHTAYCLSAPSRVDVPKPYAGSDGRPEAGCLPIDDGEPNLGPGERYGA